MIARSDGLEQCVTDMVTSCGSPGRHAGDDSDGDGGG